MLFIILNHENACASMLLLVKIHNTLMTDNDLHITVTMTVTEMRASVMIGDGHHFISNIKLMMMVGIIKKNVAAIMI